MSIGIMGDAPNIAGSDGVTAELSAESWLKHADDALYTAKEEGRNRVVLSAACTPQKSS
jgi:GGDEF domain-containing protein